MKAVGRAKGLLATVVVAVALAHLWLTATLGAQMRLGASPEGMERIQAQYVSQITLSAPPAAAPAPPVARPPRPAAPRAAQAFEPAAKASAASEAEPEAEAEVAKAPLEAETETATERDSEHDAEATADARAEADAANAEALAETALPADPPAPSQPEGAQLAKAAPSPADAFEWPLATQVRFKLSGHYRGPVQGEATVEWLREGDRYQVHVDAIVGPSFAPIGSWRLSSEGMIRADGLAPRRYENANRVFIRSTRTRATDMSTTEVALDTGKREARPSGLQDPASLLIQLAYGFIQDPGLLKPGTLITLPVATTRKLDDLTFEVQPEEILDTPMGPIRAVRVKPRHALLEKGNAPADIWFAPELQYLPVKILVRVEGQPTFMQLTLSAAPMQVRRHVAAE